MVTPLLLVATVLCTLVTGLLLGFVIVVMPGIAVLDDREHLRAFQTMDRVIQDRQPVFMLLWVGSVVAVVAATVAGLGALGALPRTLLVLAAIGWVVGVQVPTARFNIPLNNAVQDLDVARLSDAEADLARAAFESEWRRWNTLRTVVGVAVSCALAGALALA